MYFLPWHNTCYLSARATVFLAYTVRQGRGEEAEAQLQTALLPTLGYEKLSSPRTSHNVWLNPGIGWTNLIF